MLGLLHTVEEFFRAFVVDPVLAEVQVHQGSRGALLVHLSEDRGSFVADQVLRQAKLRDLRRPVPQYAEQAFEEISSQLEVGEGDLPIDARLVEEVLQPLLLLVVHVSVGLDLDRLI